MDALFSLQLTSAEGWTEETSSRKYMYMRPQAVVPDLFRFLFVCHGDEEMEEGVNEREGRAWSGLGELGARKLSAVGQ